MRLFLAIRLSDEAMHQTCDIQTALKERIDRQGVRFTAPHKMHLTLAFLGNDLEPEEAHAIASNVMNHEGPRTLTLGDIGTFPNDARPKTIWLGVSGDGLEELANTLAHAFHREVDPFVGHVTLARVSPASKAVGWLLKGFAQDRERAETVSWTANEVELIASLPGGDDQTLRTYALKATESS